MYEPGTILTLKEPRSTKDQPFPYDRVRVIGQSPIDHRLFSAEWEGANSQGVVIAPENGFGSNVDEPYGKLISLYDVDTIPTTEVDIQPVRVINSTSGQAGPTPEEVFSTEAPGVKSPDGMRGRTPQVSPLDVLPPVEVPEPPVTKPTTPPKK